MIEEHSKKVVKIAIAKKKKDNPFVIYEVILIFAAYHRLGGTLFTYYSLTAIELPH